ncbi:hypothetical protein [Streptomyces sp. NL15-2K]|uniref:hypothetical protein n=1 Tax=Streptomyces sp. NL15-2K TaxID=376149 RepID=UPI000FFA36F3|nr:MULTISPECIES: hypothetical protein [Actinomycetes]WKX09804.1 hypothetical protein Q4V64_20845 [Kutzneria buriramensis]GCB48661.1 hypothetical protein SNL152K_5988 [Streptomyces sp. NL15-2K]
MSNDPSPASANATQYAYANQNPMTGVDPTLGGLDELEHHRQGGRAGADTLGDLRQQEWVCGIRSKEVRQ